MAHTSRRIRIATGGISHTRTVQVTAERTIIPEVAGLADAAAGIDVAAIAAVEVTLAGRQIPPVVRFAATLGRIDAGSIGVGQSRTVEVAGTCRTIPNKPSIAVAGGGIDIAAVAIGYTRAVGYQECAGLVLPAVAGVAVARTVVDVAVVGVRNDGAVDVAYAQGVVPEVFTLAEAAAILEVGAVGVVVRTAVSAASEK